MKITTIFIILIAIASISRAKATQDNADVCEVRHPSAQSESDLRHKYPTALLYHLLKITEEEFGPCILTEMGALSQKRQIAWLKDGNLDVSWLPVTKSLSDSLLYVPVPIRKGLLGWRVLLVHKDNLAAFKNVDDLEALNQFTPGFGAAWGDLPVMEQNFSSVTTSVSYESLFEMLAYKRFDFLSRSLYEAFDEVHARAEKRPNLVIEPHLALRYPQADFFYFSKQSAKLQKRIATGFKKAIKEGTFNVIFYGYYGNYIDNIKMVDRVILDLNNPFVPDNVPLDDPELWFQLDVYEDFLRKSIE
jgi:hypothetical protein